MNKKKPKLMKVEIPPEIEQVLREIRKKTFKPKGMLSGQDVFNLRTSSGLPLDAIYDLAKEQELSIDIFEYWILNEEHIILSAEINAKKHGLSEKAKNRLIGRKSLVDVLRKMREDSLK